MKATDNVGITFVNIVIGSGVLNNVINLSLGSFQFTPDDEGKEVSPDLVTSCRLRMDIPCAKQLYDNLGQLLGSLDKPAEAMNGKAKTVPKTVPKQAEKTH